MEFNKIQEHILNNYTYYTITSLIFILYFSPYMFFSIIIVFSLYGFYINMNSDFQFDIKITNKKLIKKNKPILTCSIPNFDKPINIYTNESDDKQD